MEKKLLCDRNYLICVSQIAPYASVIINGIYYAPNDPRLISIPNCKELVQPTDMPWLPSSPGCPRLPHRLVNLVRTWSVHC